MVRDFVSGTAFARSITRRSGDFNVRTFGVSDPVVRISMLVPSWPRTTETPRTCTGCPLMLAAARIGFALRDSVAVAVKLAALTLAGFTESGVADVVVASVATVKTRALVSGASQTLAWCARVN